MEQNAHMKVSIQYDFSPMWELVHSERSKKMGSINIPIRPKRCDFFRLRIEGTGNFRGYSMTKTIEQGSERA
jgi:hypothetical protein